MLAVMVVAAALLGAAIGSFLNVVIARVPAGESVIRPRSHCPACGQEIRARHNVPLVSYALLRGRCADCATRISPRYPLIEAATALLFVGAVAVAWREGLLPLLPAWWLLVAAGVALAAIDIAVHRLPNAIVLPLYPAMAVCLVAASAMTGDWWALLRAGIAGAGLFGFYLLLVSVYPAGMGWGDVKLAGVVGAVTGYTSWAALIIGAFAGFAFGAVVAIVVMVSGRGTGKTALPFGPFMLLGAAVGIVAGGSLADAYLGLVGL